MCYLDVILDQNFGKVLAPDKNFAATLIIDPVLTFFTAIIFLIVTMILFYQKTYGLAATIGVCVISFFPLAKVGSLWRKLDTNRIQNEETDAHQMFDDWHEKLLPSRRFSLVKRKTSNEAFTGIGQESAASAP